MNQDVLKEEIDRLRSQNFRLARAYLELWRFVNSMLSSPDTCKLTESDYKIRLIREETINGS